MKLIWIISTLFLVGCTVTQPHVAEFILSPKIEKITYDAKICKEKSLKIGQVFASNSLMSKEMKYVEDEYKEFAFTQSEWARTPNRAISDELVKSIRNSALFANVSSFKSRAKADYLLEANIEKFMQYFEDNSEKSYVEVVLTFNLLDVKNSKSIAHTTLASRIDVKSLDAEGGVIAFNKALSKTLLETNKWLNGACK